MHRQTIYLRSCPPLPAAASGAPITVIVPGAGTASVANELAAGNVSPLARALAGVLYDALEGLLKYL